ncbi:MAG: single-stranded DNA-binding protein [Candidatus Hodarchaeota archaeon]
MSYTVNFETESKRNNVKIEDVQPLEKNLDVVFQVVEKKEGHEIYKRHSGETHRVCDFVVADDTGKIILTLWNEDIDSPEVDKSYKLENGFANIYRNSLRLTKGRHGSLIKNETEFAELNLKNDRSK